MQSILNRVFHRDSLPDSLPNISILGLDYAGKTTILHKLASTPITTTIPTIGMTIKTANIKTRTPTRNGKKPAFTVWTADVGGCSKAQSRVHRWMLRDIISGVVWVIDASDGDRLAESREELRRLLPKFCDAEEADCAMSIPVMILLTKNDLPNSKPLSTILAQFDPLLTARPHAYFEATPTAPLASSGLTEAFAWLSDALPSTSDAAPPTPSEAEKTTANNLAALRSPSALSTTLESWLARAEKDIPPETLLERFYALDLDSWDHYTHLRLAYILLLTHGRREGKDKIFTTFKTYIDNSGKINGKSFHTTLTYFWVQMVHLGIACMDAHTARDAHSLKTKTNTDANTDASERRDPRLDDFAAFLALNQYLVDGQLWADYYTKEVLMSAEARAGVVFPDIKGLPDVVASAPSIHVKEMVPAESVSVSSTTALV
ncbi:P-loop containing nucleoside triphosphate hydrolase protein [Karstenula rhodostoma CBS 690.94]|uniref:P-loop containing nucleoside triphosphate hydrolase protein n=1 Tax=Karstenula rhodostoma CBS 690.94 TaxID=1392251 RepID=A0A9P4PKP9_9PLEO|nr:P-loop containing nucleoside triphosphate hydrolase protein [Karstenula rhodostoma CBS 690.94]